MPSAQRVHWAKIRIAVVLVAAIAIMSVLVYLLSGGSWLQRKATLVTYVSDSTGLEPDADVQLNGVTIGKVESLHLGKGHDPHRVVKVSLKVQQQYLKYIPDDSVTEIDSENLLGDMYLAITMGHSSQPVRAGAELRYRAPNSLLQNIDLEQFQTQLRTIDQILRDTQEGKGQLGQFFVSDQLYGDTLSGISQIETKLHAATGTQSQVGQFLYSAEMYDKITQSLHDLDDRLAKFQNSPLLRDSKQYDDLRDQMAKLHTTIADLRAGKGSGGQMIASDEDYRQWNARLDAWIKSVHALTYSEGALGMGNAQLYESLTGSLTDLRNTMKDFRENPQKYLRIKLF